MTFDRCPTLFSLLARSGSSADEKALVAKEISNLLATDRAHTWDRAAKVVRTHGLKRGMALEECERWARAERKAAGQ